MRAPRTNSLRPLCLPLVGGLAALLAGCFGGGGESESSTRDEPAATAATHVVHAESSAQPQGVRSWTDPLRFAYYGFPRRDGIGAAPTLLFNDGYVAGYDMQRHLPLWVSYRLYAEHAHREERDLDREREAPHADSRLGPAPAQTEEQRRNPPPWLALAPRDAIEALYGARAGQETRLSSDALYMNPPRGWNELESRERRWVHDAKELWVAAGPLFATPDPADKTLVGGWRVEARVVEGQTVAQAFLLPNAPAEESRESREHPVDLASALVPVAQVTQRTGLTFFPDLHDTDRTTRTQVLTIMPLGVWPSGGGDARTAER